jgi:hypothetical protein
MNAQLFSECNLKGPPPPGGIGGNVTGSHRHSGLRSANKRKRSSPRVSRGVAERGFEHDRIAVDHSFDTDKIVGVREGGEDREKDGNGECGPGSPP